MQKRTIGLMLCLACMMIVVLCTACAAPKDVTTSIAAARVDLAVTADQMQGHYPDPATMPADVADAIGCMNRNEQILRPAQEWAQNVKPGTVQRP